MKSIRKILSATLAAIMMATLAVSASAAEEIKIPAALESNVFTAPTLVTEIGTQEQLDAIATTVPDTAIFKVNDEGKAVLNDGTVLGTATEVNALVGNTIPAFEVSTAEALNAVVADLNGSSLKDFFIVSENTELLHTAIDSYIWCRTVLRVNDSYKNEDGSYDLMKIRGDANSVGCHVVILPAEISDRYNADYLERRLIGVWTTAPDTEYGNMSAILSGGNGIITSDISGAKAALVNNFEKNTMTRQIYIIGHRGMPGLYPENTIEGSVLAIEAGADTVENDIYITKDGVIVIMHDGDISRTTNGAGNIEDFTLEQLKNYYVDTMPEYTEWKIPTLEEYFVEWKKMDTSKQLFVEIKSGKAELIDEFIRLVNEYEIADQVSVITFSQDQIKRLHAAFPEMSIGFLTSGIINDSEQSTFKTIIRSVQKLETTFNHNYDGVDADYVRTLNAHGITHWPWTYNDQGTFMKQFLTGINGMTTNYSYWVSDTAKYCFVGDGLTTTEIQIGAGQTLTEVFSTMTYNGTVGNDAEIHIVSGGDNLTADGNSLTGTNVGEAYVYATYKTNVINKPIRATSGLIKVNVTEEFVEVAPKVEETEAETVAETEAETVAETVAETEAETAAETVNETVAETAAESANENTNNTEKKSNTPVVVAVLAVIVVAAGVCVALAFKFKKKN